MHKHRIYIISLLLLLIIACKDSTTKQDSEPVKEIENTKLQISRDTCLAIELHGFMLDSTEIYKRISLNGDIDSSDFNLVSKFGYLYGSSQFEECKILVDSISNLTIRDRQGKTMLDYVLIKPNSEILALILNKLSSVEYLWENKNILYELVQNINTYATDSIIKTSGIIKKLILSDSSSVENLKQAYKKARYYDMEFISEEIKNKFPHIDIDNSKKIEIFEHELYDLKALLKVSRSMVIDGGAYTYGTCKQLPNDIYTDIRNLESDWAFFDAVSQKKYFINDSTFISGIIKTDYCEALILWRKNDQLLSSEIIFDKLFRPRKHSYVSIDTIYNNNKNSNDIFVIRMTDGGEGYMLETIEFYEWIKPRQLRNIYTVEGLTVESRKEVIEHYYNSATSELSVKKINKVKGKPDSLMIHEVFKPVN